MATQFTFTPCRDHVIIEAAYDNGWQEHLDCGGEGGWQDEIALNSNDAAICRITNIHTRASISVCGIRWIGETWTWSVIPLNGEQGITASLTDHGVTVNCKNGFTIQYESAKNLP